MLIRNVQQYLGNRGIYLSRQEPYDLAWQLRRIFPILEVNCVLDVGAHHGEFASFIRRVVAYNGRLVSFEPVSESYAELAKAAYGDPEWRTHPVALGATAQKMEMHLFGMSVFNSLREPSGFAGQRFGDSVAPVGTETVQVRTLDEFFESAVAGIPQPRVFLKLDTQGYGQEVIKGAEETLKHVVLIQAELTVKRLYEDAPGFECGIHRFSELGFDPVAFFPVSRERNEVAVIEFDFLGVRRNV
jgi:FkbM family methyltransferase